jgi:hypothetical protein
MQGNGLVLVAGGNSPPGITASVEIYDPVAGTWSTTGNMASPRASHAAARLPNGAVIVVGGISVSVLASAELYW